MEIGADILAGDGATGLDPQRSTPLPPGAPVDVGAVLLQILDEQRKQTAIAERSEKLLHRILLGDLDQLDSADVMAALGIKSTKIGQMRDEGQLPMYQRPGSDRWYIGRDTFRAIIRRWAG